MVGDVLVWLLAACQDKPEITAWELRTGLQERFGVRVSKRHINRVRSAHGLSRPKKTSRSESQWQDSAGSLVLLAAAQETGLVEVLNEAVADRSVPRLAQCENTTR